MILQDPRKQRLSDMPERYRAVTEKAYSGKSRTAGVKAKCLDCTNWQKEEIRNCTVLACPLWEYRPYQTDDSCDADAEDLNLSQS